MKLNEEELEILIELINKEIEKETNEEYYYQDDQEKSFFYLETLNGLFQKLVNYKRGIYGE